MKLLSQKAAAGSKTIEGRTLSAAMAILLGCNLFFLAFPDEPVARQAKAAADSWVSLSLIALLTLVCALAVFLLNRFERRVTEDYQTQLIAHSAAVAVGSTLVMSMVWEVAVKIGLLVRAPIADDIVSVMMISLTIGYFGFQARGLK